MDGITQIDCRRLLCPIPVIRTQDAIANLSPGDQLQVTCTDPGALHDIPSWCRINGHQVKNIEEMPGEYVFTIITGESE